MLIVDDLLGMAVKGYFGIFKKIHDLTVDEFYNEEKIKEQILDLQQLADSGEINKKEYERQETKLLERLNTARERG